MAGIKVTTTLPGHEPYDPPLKTYGFGLLERGDGTSQLVAYGDTPEETELGRIEAEKKLRELGMTHLLEGGWQLIS